MPVLVLVRRMVLELVQLPVLVVDLVEAVYLIELHGEVIGIVLQLMQHLQQLLQWYFQIRFLCRGSSSDTTANKINPYYLIG